MDDKQLIYKLLNSNYQLEFNSVFTNILVSDKVSKLALNHQKFINTFLLLFGEYTTDSNISSLDIYCEWYQENLSNLEIQKRDKIEAQTTRFHNLVNFSNKKYNDRCNFN